MKSRLEFTLRTWCCSIRWNEATSEFCNCFRAHVPSEWNFYGNLDFLGKRRYLLTGFLAWPFDFMAPLSRPTEPKLAPIIFKNVHLDTSTKPLKSFEKTTPKDS